MNDEELIKEAMMLDYSQLVMNNVYLHRENERLNNIINELDGYLDLKRKSYIEGFKWSGLEIIDQTKDFLQELKGSELKSLLVNK